MYAKFDDFFDYYIGVIASKLPNYEEILERMDMNGNQVGYKDIHALLPPLTPKEVNNLNLTLRIIMKIPMQINLVYDRNAATFYSTWDKHSKKFVIGYPTVTFYMQEFPSIIKAAMKYEMGHILNKDAFAEREKGHGDCTNRCMDARINIHIPHEEMDYLTRCIFAFKNEPGVRYINADYFYKQIHLPPSPGGYSWETAHEQYHQFDQNPPEEEGGSGGGQGQPGEPGGGQGEPSEGGGTEEEQSEIDDINETFADPVPGGDEEGDEEGDDEGNGGGGDEEGEEEGGEEGNGGKGGEEGDKEGDGKGGDGEKEGEGKDGNGKDGEPKGGKGGDTPSEAAKKRRKLKKLDAEIKKAIEVLGKLKEKY